MRLGRSRPHLATLATLTGLLVLPLSAAAQTSGPPAGRLTCTVGNTLTPATAHRPMECRFRPRRGPVQLYTGVVHRFTLDLGAIRNATMAWRIYGPYARAPLGALSGAYKGTAAAGSGNVLTGGPDNGVTLRPLPFQGHRGVNAAIGVSSLDLTLIPPGRRR